MLHLKAQKPDKQLQLSEWMNLLQPQLLEGLRKQHKTVCQSKDKCFSKNKKRMFSLINKGDFKVVI